MENANVKKLMTESRPITVRVNNLSETAMSVRKALRMPEFNEQGEKHRVIKIYPDGTPYVNDVDVRYLCDNVAYNAVYRSDAAIIVDGIVVFLGNVEENIINLSLEKLITSNISMTPKPIKKYSYA
ncbi:MAG: hypothetical protein IJ809_06960 [Clostridia bacterium]|nr:hypothetical protein [Clostridia bacterium]